MHRRKRWIVGLLLGGLVAVLGLQAVRDATAPRPPGRIAVLYDMNGHLDNVFILDAAGGTNPRQLSDLNSVASNVAWAPNGQHFLFADSTSSRTLYRINADGSQLTALTNRLDVGSAVWAPDSQRLAFTAINAQDEPSLYVINADGSGLIQLIAESSGSPAWAPDGQRIAFLSDQPTRGIYTINPDGSGLTQLVIGETTWPRWSPDGQRIVFAAVQPTAGLYAINPNGSNLTQLAAGTIDDPRWAPDGRHLAFQQAIQGEWVWMTMRPDGTQITPLITGEWAAWSPSGQQLAIFQSGIADDRDMITVFNADGMDRKDVAADMAMIGPLSWSPDSQWLAFTVVARDSLIMPITDIPKGLYAMACGLLGLRCTPAYLQYQSMAVYAVRADGSNLTLVSRLPGASREPAWQP